MEGSMSFHALIPVPSQDFGTFVDSFRMLAYNAGFLLTVLHIKPIVLGSKNFRDRYPLADFLQQFFLFETSFLQHAF